MVDSALALLILSLPMLDSWATGEYRPPADPGPHPACPSDMRLVQGVHDDEMERLCLRIKGDRCWKYVPHALATEGVRTRMRFCMDRYEAPNRSGARPIVMVDFFEAQRWCEKRGKRLCSEQEFEAACEGPGLEPYFYGWEVDVSICNSNKPWKPFDDRKLLSGGEEARKEAERLWQGTPSGGMRRCRTRDGIYDLLGNVEEWVTSRPGRRWPGALMGGFWAKPWTGCRGTNDAHEPKFAFYEVGFRCCKDAAESAR
ncbi:MAG: formylglycine-generating enzyme family protein [Myxococcota bacterium]